MSGHSKWSTIKRQKSITDAKRGAIFTKLGKLIAISARDKGGDPNINFGLRMAIDKAKQANMPKDNIERAIKRGTGELAGDNIEELLYEGFGPVKSQFIIKCLSDNKNRTAADIRHIFTKFGGSFGSVMWNFEQKGVIRIEKLEVKSKKLNTDDFELELIDAGSDDIEREEEGMTIYTKIEGLQNIKKFLDKEKIKAESAEIEYIAKEEKKLNEEEKEKVEKFIEELENNEDVSDYYTNAIT